MYVRSCQNCYLHVRAETAVSSLLDYVGDASGARSGDGGKYFRRTHIAEETVVAPQARAAGLDMLRFARDDISWVYGQESRNRGQGCRGEFAVRTLGP